MCKEELRKVMGGIEGSKRAKKKGVGGMEMGLKMKAWTKEQERWCLQNWAEGEKDAWLLVQWVTVNQKVDGWSPPRDSYGQDFLHCRGLG